MYVLLIAFIGHLLYTELYIYVRTDSIVNKLTSNFYIYVYVCLILRALIGELDEGVDANMDLTAVRAPPMKPLTH